MEVCSTSKPHASKRVYVIGFCFFIQDCVYFNMWKRLRISRIIEFLSLKFIPFFCFALLDSIANR